METVSAWLCMFLPLLAWVGSSYKGEGRWCKNQPKMPLYTSGSLLMPCAGELMALAQQPRALRWWEVARLIAAQQLTPPNRSHQAAFSRAQIGHVAHGAAPKPSIKAVYRDLVKFVSASLLPVLLYQDKLRTCRTLWYLVSCHPHLFGISGLAKHFKNYNVRLQCTILRITCICFYAQLILHPQTPCTALKSIGAKNRDLRVFPYILKPGQTHWKRRQQWEKLLCSMETAVRGPPHPSLLLPCPRCRCIQTRTQTSRQRQHARSSSFQKRELC